MTSRSRTGRSIARCRSTNGPISARSAARWNRSGRSRGERAMNLMPRGRAMLGAVGWARRFAPLLTLLVVLLNTTVAVLAAEPIKLRIASVSVPPSMHTLFMHVAHEEGIYARNGLAVDGIVQLNSGPLVTQALAAGQIDVADTDAEGVLNAAAAGFPLLAGAAPAQHLSYLVMV